MKVFKGILSGKGLKTGIVVSRFNESITTNLLKGAVDCLKKQGAESDDIDVFWVPGAFEIPKTAKTVADSGKYDGVLCIGAVIRGETPHFDFISAEATKGIAHVAMQSDIPVIYGVITTDTHEQAVDRSGGKKGNKGWDTALALMEMVNLQKHIKNC